MIWSCQDDISQEEGGPFRPSLGRRCFKMRLLYRPDDSEAFPVRNKPFIDDYDRDLLSLIA